MPESGKESETLAPKFPFPSDLSRAISQYLLGLTAAGVSQLPKSTGKFDFSASINAAPSARKTAGQSLVAEAETKAPAKSFVTPPVETATKQQPISVAETRNAKVALVRDSSSQPIYENLATYGPPVAAGDRPAQLQLVQLNVTECTACSELATTRTQTVFGVGNPTARLVFIGEAPGADEDRQGVPFVGAAGQLLTKIISAMKLSRDDVYILNTLKCRPPGNRNPKEDELRNCSNFTLQQLEILQPEFICCLGSIAAKTLLNTKQSIGRMRGQIFQWRGSRVVVTYHPAYLLRSPDAKRHVWDDMKLIMREMGLEA